MYTKFLSLIRYGIILWDGERESVKVLKIQKSVLYTNKGCIKESLVGQFLKS